MRPVEARLTEVEVKVDTFREDVGELMASIAELKASIAAQGTELRTRIAAFDQKLDTGFRWLIGVQIMTLLAIIAGLFQVVTTLLKTQM